ncbi:MAG TPA: efflux RND transporter periplasmic adaptor subunit [Ignavibacteria bacterium]|nr:efflux RND transporter periplasmic adaptor subunit [Ignavibacteria bacterium]HMR39889.1 efflux RND transporter periplasmic adaptor subunit [Ignavibacteria bacterium]
MKIHILILIIISAMSFTGCKDKEPENEINASGTIEATDVTISSKIAGQIRDILVDEGSLIKTDDVLVMLDHELLDIQLRQAAAGVDIAQAQLDLLLSGARKEDIVLAQDQVESAKINLDQAAADKERFQQLYSTYTITLKQLEDVLTKYEIALNQYNSAEENLNKIKNITRKEDIESAKANVQKNRVSMELIQQNIDDCTIKSPVTGIVSKKYSETGEYVTPGSSVMKISDLKTVNLYIYITEPELGKIKLGQSADVTIDSYKDKIYKGEIIYISPEAEFTPKSIQTKEERTKLVYAVKIKIPNPGLDLKSGMPADAKLIIN